MGYVNVFGRIWQGCRATYRYPVTAEEAEAIRAAGAGTVTREAVDAWIQKRAGDFESVEDFFAVIPTGEVKTCTCGHSEVVTVELPWVTEEAEQAFVEATCGC